MKNNKTRKGIILAGGKNSRLYPVTKAVAKSLLPVYDKPLIYYSLSILMLAGVRDILVITAPQTLESHRLLLGDGEGLGLTLSYLAQQKPRGIADAFIIGEDFIGDDCCALILADNIYYGGGLVGLLQNANRRQDGATVFACKVQNPQAFGVAAFDENGRAYSLEEKPRQPKSSFAVTGCYFYDNEVCAIAKKLKPSARGELEITDINKDYLRREKLTVEVMSRGMAWFDTGAPASLAAAANFVHAVQDRQGLMIACPEEIAFHNGWITAAALKEQGEKMKQTAYGDYLRGLAAE